MSEGLKVEKGEIDGRARDEILYNERKRERERERERERKKERKESESKSEEETGQEQETEKKCNGCDFYSPRFHLALS